MRNSITPRRKRSKKGSFIVEALVSVLVASIIAAALAQMYTQVRRATNMTQGELYAMNVAQECIDQLRVQQFSLVQNNSGSVLYPQVNGAGDPTNELFPRALLHDTNLDYSGSTTTTSGGNTTTTNGNQYVMGQAAYTFHTINPDTGVRDDTVKVELADGPIVDHSVNCTVTIKYLDTSGAVRTYTLSSMITDNGLTS